MLKDADHERLRALLEEFARVIGVRSGSIRVTLHEGVIAKIKTGLVAHLQHASGRRHSREETEVIHWESIKDFPVSTLEAMLRETIGRFGDVEATVQDGRVSAFIASLKYKGQRGQSDHPD